MAKEIGPYDSSLQMFVDKPRDIDLNHLRELRWRAERGLFGPRPFSQPRGEYLFRLSNEEIGAYVRQEREAKRPHIGVTKGEALLAHIARFGDY